MSEVNDFCKRKNQTEIDFPNQTPLFVFNFISTIIYGINFNENIVNIPWKYFS